MSFKAKIKDVFELKGQEDRLVLMINHVEGEPLEGDSAIIGDRRGKVVGLADNGIRNRSCLTGKTIPRWGTILVDLGSTDKDGLFEGTIVGASQ